MKELSKKDKLLMKAKEQMLIRPKDSENIKEARVHLLQLVAGGELVKVRRGLYAPHRLTRDVDLLGFGSSEIADVEKIFREICKREVEDGLISTRKASEARKSKKGRNTKP